MDFVKMIVGHLSQKQTIIQVLNVLAGITGMNFAPEMQGQIAAAMAAVAVLAGSLINDKS